MAYEFSDSLTDPTATVASGTSIGATSMTLTGAYSELPTGTHVVGIGSGATAELATCTRSGATLTFSVGLTYAHSAGEEVQGPINAAAVMQSFLQVTLTSAANDDIVQRKAGSWVNRTLAQLRADLQAVSSWVFSNAVRFPSGSAGTPSVQVGGTDRGMWSAGSNRTNISAGGQQMVEFYAGQATRFKNYPVVTEAGLTEGFTDVVDTDFSATGPPDEYEAYLSTYAGTIRVLSVPSGATAVHIDVGNFSSVQDAQKVTVIDAMPLFGGAGAAACGIRVDFQSTTLHTITTDEGSCEVQVDLTNSVAQILNTYA